MHGHYAYQSSWTINYPSKIQGAPWECYAVSMLSPEITIGCYIVLVFMFMKCVAMNIGRNRYHIAKHMVWTMCLCEAVKLGIPHYQKFSLISSRIREKCILKSSPNRGVMF